MRRGWKVLIGLLVVLAALLAVNAVVLNNQTKRAELTVEGAEIAELSAVDLQVLDEPAGGGSEGAGSRTEGAPIVLLHCYACSMRWWDAVAPMLQSRHRVIRFDLLGHGGSQKPGGEYAISEQAAAIAEALNAMGVEGATVVGHSLGGVVATELAARSSELVDRVVLIGAPPEPSSDNLPLASRISRWPIVGQAAWRLRIDSVVKSAYSDAFAEGFDFEAAFEDPDQVVADNEAMTYTSYDKSVAAADEYLGEQDLASRLTSAAVPVLGIYGDEDAFVDTPAAVEDLETIPGAEIRVMGEVGHSPNLEAPADTAELILRFAGAAVVNEAGSEPVAGGGQAGQTGSGKASGGKTGKRNGKAKRG